jgi:hypothetical protein
MILYSGCILEQKEIDVPPGLEALGVMKIELPENDEAEAFNSLSGEGVDLQGEVYGWAQGRGYLHGSVDQVWAAIRQPEVYINLGEVTSYEVEEKNSSQYDYLFRVWNYVENIVTVEFENEWRHGVTLGSLEEPEQVAIRWEKVSGTEFILSLNGSIKLIDQGTLEDGTPVTELQVIEHLQSTLDQEANALNYVDGLWLRWQAALHGNEIPHE